MAAGAALEMDNFVGASGGKGIIGLGLKDNKLYFGGHQVTLNGIGNENQITWDEYHTPLIRQRI